MKIVLIISTLTFLLIFGVIIVTTGMIQEFSGLIRMPNTKPDEAPELQGVDRIRASLVEERDHIQTQLEELNTKQLEYEIEEKVIDDQQARLQELIQEMHKLQKEYTADRERSVQKLAKVYESMKPDKAAPILASMNLEDVMQIMNRMKDRQAAKILTSMSPLMASEISRRMGLKGDRP